MISVVLMCIIFLSSCQANPSYEIVPSREYPPVHHYPPEHHGNGFDFPLQEPGYYGNRFGDYGRSVYPEFHTKVKHPPQGFSYIYTNQFDTDKGGKFDFNVGKGTHNTKHFPIEYQKATYVAPNGQLYVYSNDKKKPCSVKKPVNERYIFTGNRANLRQRPNTSSNRNIPRRTNQLGIPSAALASLAGGGLG